MGLTHEIAETQAAIAECVLLAGNPQRALSEAAGALGNAEQAGAARVLGSLARIRGFALLELGRNAEARAAFDDALRLTAEPGTQHERAFALAGLARLAERAGDAAGSAVLAAQSHTLLDGLGVVSVPITSWVDVRSVTAQG